MIERPIVILGFGRSGTTWLSDIVSKATGQLILFEPLHWSVIDGIDPPYPGFHPRLSEAPLAREFGYISSITYEARAEFLKDYFDDVLNKRWQRPWLLRNHVMTKERSMENLDPSFLKLLWDECSVLGFKEIRANFIIKWLQKELNPRIVFVIRHPLAVVSSLKKRLNFWEFGWSATYGRFMEQIKNSNYRLYEIANRMSPVEEVKSGKEEEEYEKIKKYAIMWAITHAIAIPTLDKLNLPLWYYEDFYQNPFSESRKLLKYLGYERAHIHPSHLFTPAMTTLKTLHGLRETESQVAEKGSAFFWESSLSEKEADLVMSVVEFFDIDLYDRSGFPKSRRQDLRS